jgi:hypothetical protein
MVFSCIILTLISQRSFRYAACNAKLPTLWLFLPGAITPDKVLHHNRRAQDGSGGKVLSTPKTGASHCVEGVGFPMNIELDVSNGMLTPRNYVR